jgi:hypothetical protein
MNTTVNSFNGLNQDIGNDMLPKEFYIDALDIRISTTNGGSNGSITNIKGNVKVFDIPQIGTGVSEVIGATNIRNTIIIFVACDGEDESTIYKFVYDDTDPTALITLTIVYDNPLLGFSKNHPIEAVGRYESGKKQGIYWSDYNKDLRSLNIADPNVLTTPIELINLHPNITYTQPLLSSIGTGGNLSPGTYQVSYRLYTFDGKQTLISPPSNMIHIVADLESNTNSDSYTGNAKGDPTSKSINVTIDVTDYHDFEKIEMIVLFHEDFKGVPLINSIEIQTLSLLDTISFIYTGFENTITPVTAIDFSMKSFAFSTCKTLVQVDNSLLVGNLKSTSFDIQELCTTFGESFDASTLRYNSSSLSMVGQPNFRSLLPGPPNYTDDEVKFNTAYNEDAHWDSRWHTDGQYKFQSNGLTLGGTGLNISYKFHLEPFYVNGSANPGITYVNNTPYSSHNLNDGYTYNNNTYDSNASPFISGLLRGYKRGEVYRFGIVFYNKAGQSSFVEYIGDIKFPDISETTNTNNSSGTNYYPLGKILSASAVTAYSMGIEFTIDFSTCPQVLAQIDSYQIVRLERTSSNKKRICSGIMKTFTNVPITAPPSGGYDLRVNGSADVLHLSTVANNGYFNNLATTAATGSEHILLGDRLTFYSPEISYGFDNVSDDIISSQALLLITGSYGSVNVSSSSVTDTSGLEMLGKSVIDLRETTGDVFSVDKTSATVTYPTNTKRRGVEYVKRFKNKETVSFGNALTDNVSDVAKSTALLDGYYMRNFYARADPSNVSTDLNNPQAGANNTVCAFYKGATGITGNIDKVQSDPNDGHSLYTTGSVSTYDYFDPVNVVSNAGSQNVKVLLDILIPKQEIYGGFNDSALTVNAFVPASPVIKKANTNPKVFGGDVFLCMHTFQASSTYNNQSFYDMAVGDQEYYNNVTRTQAIILESCINLDLTFGSTLKTGVTFSVNGGPSGVEHTRYRQESNNSNTTYGLRNYMYASNTVYSEQPTDLSFFTKPENLIINNVNDIRAMLSTVKINDEIIDSWTNFPVLSYWDVDDYGPINKIIKWKDGTFFFQDTAVGSYSINPTQVLSGDNGNETTLGSGEGFVNHSYLSTTNGSIHQWGIKASSNGLYYFDAISKKIFMLGNGNALSEIKGIHSLLNKFTGDILLRKEDGGDNPFKNKGITIGVDIVNDEVLFTFKGINQEDESFTLVYDELMQQFSSFYSAKPPIYIENKNALISPNPLSQGEAYLHNHGDYGSTYGVVKECYVTFVVNDKSDYNKVIRFIEYNSIVRTNTGVIDRALTITAFKIDTENQSTNKVLFSADRFKHKFNKWRLKIPRDQNSTSKQGRLRNTYFIVTLYFDNTSNKELILNHVLTHYDGQTF